MKDNILKIIADNPALYDAVKDVFAGQFIKEEQNLDKTDEQLGQITRARIYGLKKVGEALVEIMKHKTAPDKKVGEMPAR